MPFSDLISQPAVAQQLHRSLQRGRLAHAYLFTGPRGRGKQDMARALAQALNCPEAEHDGCGRCDSCRRIGAGAHPDVYELRPESKSRRITVDQIREFERAISLKPTMARVKVGLIVDADCLGDEASNAFLKTLEEPPAQTIIVLLSTEPQRLLPTILSRCLKISFGTGPTLSPYRARLEPSLAGFVAGGPDRIVQSYRLLADLTALLAVIRGEIRARLEAASDLDGPGELDAKMRERLEDQLAARIEGEYRAAREQVLEELYSWFGDVLLCVAGADDALLDHQQSAAGLRRAAAGVTQDRAEAAVEAIEQIRDSLNRNITELLAFEVGLLKLS